MNFYPWYYNAPRDVIYADYIPIVKSDRLALTLTEVKQHLAIDICDKTNDIQLQTMIEAVKLQAEDVTGRTLLTTTYLTFRDQFPREIMLKQSPVQSLTNIQYYLNGVLQTVDSLTYQLTQSEAYPLISLLPNKFWPSDYDRRRQTIRITFVAGYGDTETSIPQDLRIAMLNHIAYWWANRGDCTCNSAEASLPPASRAIYSDYQIKNLTGLPPSSCGFGGWY